MTAPTDGGNRQGGTIHERRLDHAHLMLLASTSHELKTPITAISGLARWLQSQHDLSEQQGAAANAIVDAVDELQRLVEKILLGARAESAADDLAIERTEVVPLLSAIAQPFAVPGTKHPLRVDVSDPAIAVMCDRRAMRTAVGQLIENAIKYSPDGGEIALRACADDDGAVQIAVTDQGIGFEPSDAEFLFVTFYQGERRVPGGVGLGLSIVRRLVEAQGGAVTASGRPGEGATFTITLPAAEGGDLQKLG